MKNTDFIASWIEGTEDAVKNGYLAQGPRDVKSHAQHWASKLDVQNEGEGEDGLNGLFDPIPLATGEMLLPEIVTPLMIAPIAVYLSVTDDPVLMVNSGGGDYFAGVSVANLVRGNGNTRVVVTGQAYSAASIIVAAGNERMMAESTTLGIHRVSWMVMGNADDFRKGLEELEILDGTLAQFYATVGRYSAERFAKIMAVDTRMDYTQAKRAGLVDGEVSGQTVPAQKPDEEDEPRRRRRRNAKASPAILADDFDFVGRA